MRKQHEGVSKLGQIWMAAGQNKPNTVRGLIGSEGEQMIRIRSSLLAERRSGCFRTVHAEMSRPDLDLFNLQDVVDDRSEQMHEGPGRESGL